MAHQRRKCKLASSKHKDTDLRNYEGFIINTVNSIIPNKKPKVFCDYFSTDPLTQSEAVLLGRALSKIPELCGLGKTVTIFRLFDGKTYESEESTKPVTKTPKGGRMK